jgi:hypothetical protein
MNMEKIAFAALALLLLLASFGCIGAKSDSGGVEVHVGKQQPIAGALANETAQPESGMSVKYADALSGIDGDIGDASRIIRNEELASNLSFSLYRSSQLD